MKFWKKAVVAILTVISLLSPVPAIASHGTFAHWDRDFDGTFGSTCDQEYEHGGYEVAEVELWDSLSSSWRSSGVLQDAISQYEDAMWEGTICVRVTLKDNNQQARQNCPMTQTGTVRICNGTWPNNDVYYGLFVAQPGSGHLDNNDMNLRLDDNEIGTTYSQRLGFLCHELGHALGLDEDYDSTEPSCMDSTNWSTAPSQHDIDTLNAKYQHTHEYEDFNLHWRRDASGGAACGYLPKSAYAQVWDSTTQDWRSTGILEDVVNYYEQATGYKLCIGVWETSNSQSTRQNCPYAEGVVRLCNGTWPGVDYSEYVVWSTSVHLDNAEQRVRLDDAEIGTSIASRRYILCHELGHALGLDAHNPNPDSCMSVGNATPDPDQFDIDTLNFDYSHTH